MIVLLVYPDGNRVYSLYHSNSTNKATDNDGMIHSSCYLSIESKSHFKNFNIQTHGWINKPYEVFQEDEIGYRFYIPDYGYDGLEIVYVFSIKDFSIEESKYPLLEYFKSRVGITSVRSQEIEDVEFNIEPIEITPFREVKKI